MIFAQFEEIMDLLGALGVLVRVAEAGSFSAVAREREVSQSAVTRQISQLEEHFRVRLFHRTTRRLSLTDDGQVLLGHARHVLETVEGMEAALGRQSSSPTGLVRVGVTVASSRFLATRIPVLLAEHPGLKVELVVHDQFGDMIEERLDLAMRRGEIADASLVVRRVGMFGSAVVASPIYLERHGAPSAPADLANHTCLVHDTGPNSDLWHFTGPNGTLSVRVSGGFIANDSSAVRLAARAGHGIALLPEVQVIDDLHAGHLFRLLSDYPSQRVPVHLVYPSRRNLAPRTRVVMDFLLQRMRQIQALLDVETEVAKEDSLLQEAAGHKR
jgi:DNA-binding transcriptional LysR family regulator